MRRLGGSMAALALFGLIGALVAIAVGGGTAASGVSTPAKLRPVREAPVLASTVVGKGALPRVGVAFDLTIRTCTASLVPGTPTNSSQCAAWAGSGPVNVVIISHASAPSASPYVALMGATGMWRPALGGWLVARAGSKLAGPFCIPGWHDSGQQVEQRIDGRNRRHFKFFTACSGPDATVTFGEAHTDNFLLRGCGGDHMTDLDRARDALATSYASIPGVTVRYFQDQAPTGRYPDGCGNWVPSDGRVAYIVMGG